MVCLVAGNVRTQEGKSMKSCCFCRVQDGGLKTFDDVLTHLNGLGLFNMDMGLARMKGTLEKLGLTRFPCPAVQVVGTNGKGSTATFLQSLALAHGFRAGLYTSPHFVSPTERIRMMNRALPEEAWPGLANRALEAEPGLTYFELLTVMAALAFYDAEPDLLIFEAGLGGRYDATSALPLDMTCFTPIDLDHMHVLGPDVASIAADKADALHEGMFCAVSAPQVPEAWQALEKKAGTLKLPLFDTTAAHAGHELPSSLSPLLSLADTAPLGLYGPHQRINAKTALAAWLLICDREGWKTDEKTIRKGLAEAFIPGRLQYVEAQGGYPAFLLDGAHNTHGMRALSSAFMPDESGKRRFVPSAVIFSCLADKAPEQLIPVLMDMLKGIAPDIPVYVPIIADNPRAARPEDLARIIGNAAHPLPSLHDAVEQVKPFSGSGPVLICGSLYLLAEFFTLFPHALHARGGLPDAQS